MRFFGKKRAKKMQKSALDKGPKPLPTASENHDVTEKDRLLPDHIAITILASTPLFVKETFFQKSLMQCTSFPLFVFGKPSRFLRKKRRKSSMAKCTKKQCIKYTPTLILFIEKRKTAITRDFCKLYMHCYIFLSKQKFRQNFINLHRFFPFS